MTLYSQVWRVIRVSTLCIQNLAPLVSSYHMPSTSADQVTADAHAVELAQVRLAYFACRPWLWCAGSSPSNPSKRR